MRGRCRTAWGRAGTWHGRPPVAVRLGAVAVALGTTAALAPGQAALAAAGAPGTTLAPSPYAFADGAQSIDGARSTADAPLLKPGTPYKSSLPSNGKVNYSLQLDAVSNAYVSVTAVPSPGSSVSVIDGIKVSVQDAEGVSCSVDTASFGAARSPHPIAAWGMRERSPAKPLCREAGTYYVSVERVDPDGEGSSPDAWDLELVATTEPPTAKTGATSAPEAWDSASPQPLQGQAERRRGGAGFAAATPLDQGVWRDDIRPGQTLFYEVPVDWGRQLHVTADLGSSDSTGTGYTPDALDLALYNPARGPVADVGVGYDGDQKSGSLPPLPPVDHANRYAVTRQVSAVRFAGSYYLVAHLSESVADSFGDGPFPMTLRVRVDGTAQAGPAYAGESAPKDVFEVTDEDREAAAEGVAAGDDTVMRAVAVGGIGTGSALLVGLGVWTLVARRRPAA
ncbi:membrane protein [Streptomyces olindensis]|nr:membrane protein [Streptomyces olindensis]